VNSPAAPEQTAEFAAFARELALAARRETLARFTRDCRVENKGTDGQFDPVTDADRAAEAAMRALIEQRFPEHGIRGEEFDEHVATSSYSWSLDPIDGTRSFMCGLPTWVTLVALLSEGQAVLGLVDAPCLDELYVGTAVGASMSRAGGSAAALRTSPCSTLAEARLSTTDPYLFQGAAAAAFKELTNASRTVRFGHDGYAYARLAAGTLDLVVECGLKPHDYNALIPVVRGAGGIIGDWRGEADFAPGNVIAAATPELYEAAVVIMREAS
jgi:histidinol phosphatase-like enzyme (inositol monophosphatase family)